jgi:hypothetical protein
MERIRQLKFNVFLYVIAVLAVFVALINISRTYKSQADVMLISRNEATAKNMDRIVEDAREIPLTLSFYNRIIAEGFEDAAEELPDYKREAYWKEKIRTEKVDGSSIIRITIFEKDQIAAEDLSQQSALSLADALGRYYNIKTELDTRIINGPIVSYGFKEDLFILFLKSLLGGLIFVFAVYVINHILGYLVAGTKIKKVMPAGLDYKIPEASRKEAKPISFDKKPTDDKKNIVKEISLGKKAAAPLNLPIADESIFQSIDMAPAKAEESKKEKIADNPIIREATPEEVKERINRLLRGDL